MALARRKVDVIIGNPPWLKYSNTISTLRTELERQSKNIYDIWVGGKYAPVQDVAGMFFTRCTDLYVKEDGVVGMVMPHSVLQSGQYSKWRTGNWQARQRSTGLAVDFSYKTAWDLEGLDPNTFFPVPAAVVFARRLVTGGQAGPLAGTVERWHGKAGENYVKRGPTPITHTSAVNVSPYSAHAREGATVRPTRLFFVEETENPAIIRARQTITVNPRRGSQDKEPWRSLDLNPITGQTIESKHLFNIYLGETIVPYVALEPLKALLPLKQGDTQLPSNVNGVGGIQLGKLERAMRERWQTIANLWEEHKAAANKLSLLEQLDYFGKLSAQLEWRSNLDTRPIRVVYTKSGDPTAALLFDDTAIVAYTLYWIACKDIQEANYLLAIINSRTLYEAVDPFMAKGQFGSRDLVKHLWKLPIPEFDPGNEQHIAIAKAGEAAAQGAAHQLEQLREQRDRVTVTVARRELRKWLRESKEGKVVEREVGRLLRGG